MATRNNKREALQILRAFQVAGELSTAADIHVLKEVSPRPTTRLIAVVYSKTQYIALTDNGVDDDVELIKDIITQHFPGVVGKFVQNPHEDSFDTYGMRHKFRDTYLFEVIPQTVRLDIELQRRFPDLTRSTIQKYIKAGYVHVDGEVQKKSSKDVSAVDDIALQLPVPEDHSAKEFPILYIDDNVIVIHKPEGVLTHSKGVMNDEFTVADFFRRYTTHGLHTNRPGIVHRLDRDTSGVIIGARTDEAADLLKRQFANRTVKKVYAAVVQGVPKHEKAMIDLPIGRNPTAPSTFRVDPNGKPALTALQLDKTNGTYSLVTLTPKTGRTHQLRVHMQYIGCPIVGDRVYGKAAKDMRMFLHAYSLEITIPHSKRQVFASPIPKQFQAMVKE